MWEDEAFSEVTCPFVQALALWLAFSSTLSPSKWSSGSGFASGYTGALEESSSASMRASGSSFASGCTYLRFNIEGPAKPKVGTSMPKLAQLAGFNN